MLMQIWLLVSNAQLFCRASGGEDGKSTVFEVAIRPVTEAIMADLGSQPMSAPAAKLLSQVMHWQEGEHRRAGIGQAPAMAPQTNCMQTPQQLNSRHFVRSDYAGYKIISSCLFAMQAGRARWT